MGWPTSIRTAYKVDGEPSGFGTRVVVTGNFVDDIGAAIRVAGIALDVKDDLGVEFPSGEKTKKWEFSGTVSRYSRNYEAAPRIPNWHDEIEGGEFYACALLQRKYLTVQSGAAQGKGSITVSCGRRTKIGETISYKATPSTDEGYIIDYVEIWDGEKYVRNTGVGSRDLTGSFKVAGNITALPIEVYAYFKTAEVSIRTRAVGKGTVYPQSQTLRSGKSFSIHAVPETGYNFVKWTQHPQGKESTQADYNGTAWVNDEVWSAEFTSPEYTVTVRPNDSTYGTTNGGGKFKYGENIVIYAQPYDGYELDHWSDFEYGKVRRRPLKVERNDEIIAVFKPKVINIWCNCDPVGSGDIMGSEIEYRYGDEVTLVAMPNKGYEFDKWVGKTSTDSTLKFTATADVSCIAKMKKQKFSVSVFAGRGGTVSGGGTVDYGTSMTVKAIPDESFVFDHWKDQSGNTYGAAEMTFAVDHIYVLTAIFIEKEGSLIYDN